MTLRLNGSTSGYVEIDAPDEAGSNTLVLPNGNGTNGQVLSTNGSGALSFVDRPRQVLSTSVASTSGTEIDFTEIPSWVKRVTVMFSAVSTSAGTSLIIRLGDSGGIETADYESACSNLSASISSNASVVGLLLAVYGSADAAFSGSITISNFSGNQWVSTGVLGRDDTNASHASGGRKELSGTLDRIRITTINGTHTFDAGAINIMYEG